MAHSKKHDRTCNMCGKEYSYCPRCDEYKHMEPWHLAYCSQNCMDIDFILSDWATHLIDTETAKERLKGKDTSRSEFWNDSFRATYNEIMGVTPATDAADEATPVEETAPIEETPVEEVAPVEEATAPVEEPKVEPTEAVRESEHLSVSEELKKHNNHHNKYNKKN